MKKSLSAFQLLTITYLALIASWYVSWLVVGDGNWWLTVVNRIVPYLFLPVPLILMGVILFRDFKALTTLVPPVLIFVNLYHPYLLPKLPRSDASDAQVRVLTYNVLYSNQDYDAVANIILTYQPDLVALQEVQPEMMEALEETLKASYPFSKMGWEHDYGTTAVFSRHPFTDAYVLDLQVDRPAVVVKTKIYDRKITFVAVHFLAYGLWWEKLKDIPSAVMERTAEQNRQVEILLEKVRNEDGIVLIGCDCNSKETSSSYRLFDQTLNNSARQVGLLVKQSEFIGVHPDVDLQHIDYVWYGGNLNPAEVHRVNASGGSDHLPVLAIFDLK